MKLIFLSSAVFVYGYFCDICVKICEKAANRAVIKGKPMTSRTIVFISNLANNSLMRWQRMEKRFIGLLALKLNS